MANYAHTKDIIAQNIYTNHEGRVTAEMVKTAANEIVKTLIDGGYLYAGVAKLTPTQTNPGSPDANVFYIATEPGTYTNFVGAGGSLVVAEGEVAIFKFNGTWSKEVTGAATAVQVTELGPTNDYSVNKAIKKIFIDTSNYSGSVDISSGLQITKIFNNNNGNYGIRLANQEGETIEDWLFTDPSKPLIRKKMRLFVYAEIDYSKYSAGATDVTAKINDNAYQKFNDIRNTLADEFISGTYKITSVTRNADGDVTGFEFTFLNGWDAVASITRNTDGYVTHIQINLSPNYWDFGIRINRDSDGNVTTTLIEY